MTSTDEVEGDRSSLFLLGWVMECRRRGLHHPRTRKSRVLEMVARGRSLGRACSEVGVEGRMFQGSAGSIGKMPSSGRLDGGAKHLSKVFHDLLVLDGRP